MLPPWMPTKSKRGRKPKDSTEPKKPQTAAIFYTAHRRMQLRGEGSTLTGVELIAQTREEWKTLNEAARAPYEEQARANRGRYEAAMETYVPSVVHPSMMTKAGRLRKDPRRSGKHLELLMDTVLRGKVKLRLAGDVLRTGSNLWLPCAYGVWAAMCDPWLKLFDPCMSRCTTTCVMCLPPRPMHLPPHPPPPPQLPPLPLKMRQLHHRLLMDYRS